MIILHTPLEINDGDDFLAMVFKTREFENKEENKEINAPTDKQKWFMTPQTVNAYYHPSLNELFSQQLFSSIPSLIRTPMMLSTLEAWGL